MPADALTTIIAALIGSGPIGILTAVLVYWIYQLQGKLSDSEARRVADQAAFTDRALLLSDKIHATIDKLATIAEVITRSQGKPNG